MDCHLSGCFGFSMSLDASNALLVLLDMGSDYIYALTLESQNHSSCPLMATLSGRKAHSPETRRGLCHSFPPADYRPQMKLVVSRKSTRS